MSAEPSILWFEEVGAADVPRVGGKNASLGEMVRALSGAACAFRQASRRPLRPIGACGRQRLGGAIQARSTRSNGRPAWRRRARRSAG